MLASPRMRTGLYRKVMAWFLNHLHLVVVQPFRIHDVGSLGSKGLWKRAGIFIMHERGQGIHHQNLSVMWVMQNVV